ncbi:hypothetical protein BpHYR1_011700 [Brachionus plicatilis]|uniref:Uncharacterized protein n=1 Tax=Brachionus plicatilis TaxID=10195 RepID=A0A3M7RAV0_BRAPC|nr:hypothetical protein BpHYR1_011700 [Brachionus plicatilis]
MESASKCWNSYKDKEKNLRIAMLKDLVVVVITRGCEYFEINFICLYDCFLFKNFQLMQRRRTFFILYSNENNHHPSHPQMGIHIFIWSDYISIN